MYHIQGKNKKVKFTQNDFVAKGGEGSIYRRGNVIYKIYEDPFKMIPEAKIKELNNVNDNNIIKPIDIILDPTNTIVGFTMRYVKGEALCKLFTNDFRNRNNISEDMILELVENIKDSTYKIHDAKCLIVDGNEFNYMVDDSFVVPYFIDINSWQTPSFPATAIMPSVRDWKSSIFSTVTDWFSFAVVTFQLFIGIHPYKGKHRKYKKNDFQKRVVDCVSVFNKDVRIPPAARSFDLIPTHYKDWYYGLFEDGKRTEPPMTAGVRGPITTRHIIINSTDNFEVKEIRKFDSEIIYYNVTHGMEVIKTKNSLYVNGKKYTVDPNVEVLFTTQNLNPIFVKIEDMEIKYFSPESIKINNSHLTCSDKMIYKNSLFIKNEGKLIEISLNEMNNQIFPAVKHTWGILPNASEMFSGCVSQSVFGNQFFVIIEPNQSGNSKSFIIKIDELDGYRVVDAKYESNVLIATTYKDSKYDRFIIKFNLNNSKYNYRTEYDIDFMPANFIVLDNGIVISVNEQDAVQIFSNQYGKDAIKEIKDPAIDSSMKLVKDGTQAKFFKGNKLFSIKTKK
jgi:hypothetical protein